MRKELLVAIKQGNTNIFYKSTEWLNKRNNILKRDNNECQRCKSFGGYHKAECVHHIKHLKDFPELALTDENLTSLCYSCHNIEHPEKLHLNVKKKFINEERW
ncbi:TPA: HNH endonuclease [Clostridium botulinum]|uniref:HNH endonuclease n=1 Tax=Clostridium botulinum TaxID=1491 RepID=UPI000774C37E|nr:HNH endonuclease signature motif containing protein [Clostridium botulinum]MBN3360472.1 HNH endonuclease [Clostridium botulinum]MBY6900423.1 HNH endonuclease [Clostridium botulinum]MBY6914710.1 HNH endonuclease [Clostridium botulinum]